MIKKRELDSSEIKWLKSQIPGGAGSMAISELFPKSFSSYALLNADGAPSNRRLMLVEGDLSKAQTKELVHSLAPYTSSTEVICFYDPMFLITRDDMNKLPLALSCDLTEVPEFITDPETECIPTYWWPMSLEWMCYHDIDLGYAVFGGSKEAVNALTKLSFEVIPSDPRFMTSEFLDLEMKKPGTA